jgi:hypothetical protein
MGNSGDECETKNEAAILHCTGRARACVLRSGLGRRSVTVERPGVPQRVRDRRKFHYPRLARVSKPRRAPGHTAAATKQTRGGTPGCKRTPSVQRCHRAVTAGPGAGMHSESVACGAAALLAGTVGRAQGPRQDPEDPRDRALRPRAGAETCVCGGSRRPPRGGGGSQGELWYFEVP